MDIEGNRHGIRRRRNVIWRHRSRLSNDLDLFPSICFLVCLGCELLCERKQRALAVFFVMLEIISLLLDVFGQSRRSILLAAFLLSVLGFAITILTCMLERPRVHAEKQLGVVEIGFSVVQLIATFLAVLRIKISNSYTAQVLLLVFAIVAAVFIFRKDENIIGSLTPTNEYENELQVNENELLVDENELRVDENELQLMEIIYIENASKLKSYRIIETLINSICLPLKYLTIITIPALTTMSDEMWQQLLSGQLHSLKMLTLQDFPVSENELPSLMETVSTENARRLEIVQKFVAILKSLRLPLKKTPFRKLESVAFQRWFPSNSRPFFNLEQLHSLEIHMPSPFDLNSINWKCRSLKPVQKNYIIEVELCGSKGKLRLPEDADKLLHGDNEWANKLNMAANKISSMRRRKPVDRKLKQETEMSVENLEEEKKSK
ncbi:hypothetical protein Pint_19643 [Pistacia integerrima]|uniref:Uncharacterized protein n=1 Tax=Pistacia integerrima TaxID=434235 RepID=A0ACC0XA68_9ROSI|nr:hypothetical protein Pint_19643 [Pistacia integerrima]